MSLYITDEGIDKLRSRIDLFKALEQTCNMKGYDAYANLLTGCIQELEHILSEAERVEELIIQPKTFFSGDNFLINFLKENDAKILRHHVENKN